MDLAVNCIIWLIVWWWPRLPIGLWCWKRTARNGAIRTRAGPQPLNQSESAAGQNMSASPLWHPPILDQQVSAIESAEPFNSNGDILKTATRVVRLPIVDGLAARPPQLPLAFPAQFGDILLKHHSNPPAFFIGQLLKFLMRENEQAKKFIQKVEKQIPFELGKQKRIYQLERNIICIKMGCGHLEQNGQSKTKQRKNG